MKNHTLIRTLLILATLTLLRNPAVAAPVGTAFTYQGRLTDAQGASANGLFDLQFTLFDAPTNGTPQGVVTNKDVAVTNGLVTVELDFGTNVFTGAARWLEIGVRPGTNTGAFSVLRPRQSVTPTPYSLFSVNSAGVLPGGQLAGTQTNAVNFTNPANTFTGSFSGDGSGLSNLNSANLTGTIAVVPVGSIIAWAKSLSGVPALPTNFQECNGQVLNDASSPLNGATLPDLNGANRFLRGNSMSGATGGVEQVVLTLDQLPSHNHPEQYANHFQAYNYTSVGGMGNVPILGSVPRQGAALDTTDPTTTGSVGANQPHENRPPFYDVVWIMRVK
jgi:hypothetical protein